MHIRLLAIGTKMPDWVSQGYHEYAKRFPPSCTLELIEIPAEKRLKQSDIHQLKEREGKKILNVIKSTHQIIALEVNGRAWSTQDLAKNLRNWQQEGRNIDLIIGGPDGLAANILEKSHLTWSLSPLTLPHPLVRIVVAEQLYRALSIHQNHPYHR